MQKCSDKMLMATAGPPAGAPAPSGESACSGVPSGTCGSQSLTQLQCGHQERGQALVAGASPLGTEEENSPCPLGGGPQGQSRESFQSPMMQAVWDSSVS